jgi:hypothetical protein
MAHPMVHNVIGFGKVGSICSFRPAFDANHGGETNHIEMLPNAAVRRVSTMACWGLHGSSRHGFIEIDGSWCAK